MAKKTPEQIAEENAVALEERKKAWLDKAREAEKALSDDEAELKALMKKIAERKRTIARAKQYVRKQTAENLFDLIIKKLELGAEEKNCKTESDYNKLLEKIKEQLNLIDDVQEDLESTEPDADDVKSELPKMDEPEPEQTNQEPEPEAEELKIEATETEPLPEGCRLDEKGRLVRPGHYPPKNNN